MALLLPVFGKSFSLPIILGGIFLFFFCVNVEARYQELDSLRPAQLQTLADFKKKVLPLLPQEYMKEDIWLIKYLSFNRFNVPKAVSHLKESLKWREDLKVYDELKLSKDVPSQNYADMQRDFPVFLDGYDKEGRPICDMPFGSWNIRKAALAGNIKRLVNHQLINCYERAEVRIREQQALGKNVTQWILLANMVDFTIATHACPSCIPGIVGFAAGIDKYYPNSPRGFWLPNTPDAFSVIIRIIRPVLTPATRAAIIPLSANEKEWKDYLYKRIDPDQLGTWYGGPRERHT